MSSHRRSWSRSDHKQEVLINDELRMKADELERLFAAHKLRIHNSAPKAAAAAEIAVRGEFYEIYMKKREEKLRGEYWGVKRTQRESEMKAMRECLERSWADFNSARHGGFGDGSSEDFSIDARGRAEKMRSFSVRSGSRSQHQLMETSQSEEEEDYKAQFGGDSSKSISSKKLLSTRSMSSATRFSGAPMPRPSVKPPKSGPSSHSVTISSEFRKENTKPSPPTRTSKAITRAQPSNFARSKSASEGMSYSKEEKPPRSHSLRKSSANPLTPLVLSKETSGSKPSHRKQKDSFDMVLDTEYFDDSGTTKDVHEGMSDVDSSADFSSGDSLASWNSNDSTRVRKKWEISRRPLVLASDASHRSRKDSPKGFKRLLKFGRKSMGEEGTAANW